MAQIQTYRKLLTRALQLIGVVAEGQTPTAQQLQDALYTCNEILDSWNNNGNLQFAFKFVSFPVGNSQMIYTIGPGGDFDVPERPVFIEYARFQQQTNPIVNFPLQIINYDMWASIRVEQIQTTIPVYLYYEPQFPLGNIYLWPQPTVTGNLVLTDWANLNSSVTLDDEVALPQAYARLLRYGVAINIAPEFGKQASGTVVAVYAALKDEIAYNNINGQDLVYDSASHGASGGAGVYDVITDRIY